MSIKVNGREIFIDKKLLLNDCSFLPYASKDLRADREVILHAVSLDGRYLQYASKDLTADKEIVLIALHKRGYALEFASEDLRDDKEVILDAVSRSGFNLQHASKRLRADKEVVITAVSKMSGAIKYASEDLIADKEVLLYAYACGWEYISLKNIDIIGLREHIDNIRRSIKYAKTILYYSRVNRENIFNKLNHDVINIIISFLSISPYTVNDYECLHIVKTVKKAYKNINNYFEFCKNYF